MVARSRISKGLAGLAMGRLAGQRLRHGLGQDEQHFVATHDDILALLLGKVRQRCERPLIALVAFGRVEFQRGQARGADRDQVVGRIERSELSILEKGFFTPQEELSISLQRNCTTRGTLEVNRRPGRASPRAGASA